MISIILCILLGIITLIIFYEIYLTKEKKNTYLLLISLLTVQLILCILNLN